jgi:hypothetical protein
MRKVFQSTRARLFDQGGLKELFDHLRNLLMATLVIAAGSYAIREAAVIQLFGVLEVELAGYLVIAIGLPLVGLNALNGLLQLNRQRWHIGFRIAAIVLYLVGTVHLLPLVVVLRDG